MHHLNAALMLSFHKCHAYLSTQICNLEEQLEQFREELENKSEEVQQLQMQLEIQRKEISSQQEYLETRDSLLQVNSPARPSTFILDRQHSLRMCRLSSIDLGFLLTYIFIYKVRTSSRQGTLSKPPRH